METTQLYSDDFMLSRLIASISSSGKKNTKINVAEPSIQKKNGKTFFFNFREFVNSIRREELHLKLYLESELNVETSVTEGGMLIVDKSFDPKRIIGILEQYINTYVTCKAIKCQSLCTTFVKEDRINYLVCDICNSKHAMKLKISNV